MFKDDIIGFSEGFYLQSATSLCNSPPLCAFHAYPELMTIHAVVEKAPAWPSLTHTSSVVLLKRVQLPEDCDLYQPVVITNILLYLEPVRD